MAGAYGKIEGHEKLCAERYSNIHGRLDLLFAAMGAAAMIFVGAGGWAFSKVWDSQQQQLHALQTVVDQVDRRGDLRAALPR